MVVTCCDVSSTHRKPELQYIAMHKKAAILMALRPVLVQTMLTCIMNDTTSSALPERSLLGGEWPGSISTFLQATWLPQVLLQVRSELKPTGEVAARYPLIRVLHRMRHWTSAETATLHAAKAVATELRLETAGFSAPAKWLDGP